MNLVDACIKLFKVLTAGAAVAAVGYSVYKGITDCQERKKAQQQPNFSSSTQSNSSVNDNQSGSFVCGENGLTPVNPANSTPIQQNNGDYKKGIGCDEILSGLQSAQNMCRSIIGISSAVSGVVHCINGLFNGIQSPDNQYQMPGANYQNYGNCNNNCNYYNKYRKEDIVATVDNGQYIQVRRGPNSFELLPGPNNPNYNPNLVDYGWGF